VARAAVPEIKKWLQVESAKTKTVSAGMPQTAVAPAE